MKFSALAIVAALMVQPSAAFQPPIVQPKLSMQPSALFQSPSPHSLDAFGDANNHGSNDANHENHSINNNHSNNNNNNDSNNNKRSKMRRLASFVSRKTQQIGKPLTRAAPFAIAALMAAQQPLPAQASAPVMAKPQTQTVDPAENAMRQNSKRRQRAAQAELTAHTEKCRQIEKEQGSAARGAYEKQYKARKEQEAIEHDEGLVQLKRDLLAKGICPFTDMEGQRQVIDYDAGVDLGKVSGTLYNKEVRLQEKKPEKSWRYQKQAHREIVRCMAQDMRNRGIDEVEYFQIHTTKTRMIHDLPTDQAIALATQYRANLEQYGQITEPNEGEKSVKEIMAEKEAAAQSPAAAKAAAKAAKEQKRAEAKAAKEQARAEAKAAKEQAKAEAKAAKEQARQAKADAKAAAAMAATGVVAEPVVEPAVEDVTPEPEQPPAAITQDADAIVASETPTEITPTSKSTIPAAAKGAAVVVAIGGAAYAFRSMQASNEKKEAERQESLKLMWGDADDTATKSTDADLDAAFGAEDASPLDASTSEASAPAEAPAPVKKKRRGIKMFGKKKNDRETDISALVATSAKAPEFAKTLAKILTFGAPGRFPDVVALPGDMPLTEFSVETANEILVEAQTSAGLTKEESAELFANVVNCMLIDIVDLASAALGEKDDKVVVSALSIVVDFMNHAASLFNSIAEGVDIKPVTYGGNLNKKQLEQMYGAFSSSGMTDMENIADDFDNRVTLLQDVFQINDKKAEGIMMKTVQKNMMDMMKDGKGMEGMQDMMKGMEGMEGMGDMANLMGGLDGGVDGEEPSPEQLKEMLQSLKMLKDSGAIPDSELAEVKKQFKEAFGSGIEEVMKEADGNVDQLETQDKELLELMKAILDD